MVTNRIQICSTTWGSEWDENKFKPQDPRNLLVDPDVVVEAYKKLGSLKAAA